MSAFFLSPLFLIGVLFAAIPVVIHLFFQRRAPQVYFSTVRFLKLCIRKTARRKRIENLLLLAFRVALFTLLAAALAQPFFKSSAATGRGPSSTVIILDNSYSMATRQEGEERFARAKTVAARLVREMSPADSVALLLAGGPQAAGAVELNHRLNDTASAVDQAEVFAGHTNLTALINRACEIIAGSQDANREIIVITDMQENSFEGEPAEVVRSHREVPLIFYDCGQEAVVNLAVVGVSLQGGARAGSSRSTLIADVLNPTDSEVKDARVTLYVDKRAVKEERINVQPHARTRVSFPCTFPEAKTVTGWVQLSEDSLPVDNRFNFRIGVESRIDVLVLRDEAAGISYLDEGYYLTRALDPRGGRSGESVSPIRPKSALMTELPRLPLESFGVVFVVNVRELDAASTGRLRKYAEAGGTVMIFLGDRVDTSHYASAFRPDGAGLFPASLASSVGDAEKHEQSWQMTGVDFVAGGLVRLKSLAPVLFERVRAFRFWTLSDLPAGKVRVLARLKSDKASPESAPLLAAADLGDGRVLVVTVPATTGWSNFPATKVFVPMLHELVYSATGKTGRLESLVAGQPKRFDFNDVKGQVAVSVETRPGYMEVKKSSNDASGNTVVFDDLYQPGIYRCVLSGAKQGEDWFVVNPDTKESELARINESTLRGKFATQQVLVARSAEQLAEERSRLREGYPLAGYVFLLVVVIAMFELFLANRTRPAAAPQPVQPETAS